LEAPVYTVTKKNLWLRSVYLDRFLGYGKAGGSQPQLHGGEGDY
jgi:hypothetical protein